MKRMFLGSSVGVLLLFFSALPVQALPLSVDMDPGTVGIQSSLTMTQGDTFSIDVVITGDGVTFFDTTSFDVVYNDTGPILTLSSGPTAGTLAVWAPLVFDIFGPPVPVVPGSPLATGAAVPPPGFADNIGGVGLISVSGPFFIPPGLDVDILSLSFQANAAGMSTLDLVGIFGSPLLTMPGIPVPATVAFGTVTVTSAPVPEPSTMLLFASGLLGLAGFRRRFRKR